jgi:hypothetical protein
MSTPFIPADAGIQSLPQSKSVRFGKVWIPAHSPSKTGVNALWRGNERRMRHVTRQTKEFTEERS